MNYILIENKGILEPLSIFMMGASTKRDEEEKIGRFGSGFKYAIAKLMRDNVSVRIFAGETEVMIGTVPFTLRNKEFHAITVNSERTSITTEMGPDWKTWQVIREIWCNALDEGGADMMQGIDEDNIQGIDNYTRIYIELTESIADVIKLWDRYFSVDRDDKINIPETDKFSIFLATDNKAVLYRRGILVYENKQQNALYHYDYSKFSISEDRVLDSYYWAVHEIADQLATYATEDVAAHIMRNASMMKTIENELRWDGYKLNDSWINAAERFDHVILSSKSGYYSSIFTSDNLAFVNDELGRMLMAVGVKVLGLDAKGRKNEWMVFEENLWTSKQKFLLKSTMDNLSNELGYPITYPVRIVDFDSKNTLARANDQDGANEILLSIKLFDMGKRQIAVALMEEQEHLNTSLADETRGLQNHLFSKWLAALEEKAGFFF